MYRVIMAIEEDGKIIDSTVLDSVGHRGLAQCMLAEWSNAIKEMVKELINANGRRQKAQSPEADGQ